jgi:hypothetical protein
LIQQLPLKLVADWDAECFAREFARLNNRRVKAYSTVTADGIEQRFTVSVRDGRRPTRRNTCGPQTVDGDLDSVLPRGMRCSVGAPFPGFTHSSRFRAGKRDELPVFVTSQDSERVQELLQIPGLVSALDVSDLGPSEYLQTVAGLGFALRSPSQQRVESVFAALEELYGSLSTSVSPALPSRYPSILRPISPLVLEWGILDTAARAERIRDAHPDALRRLMGSGRIYAHKIDAYLTRTRFPDSEAAQTVRAFTEAVALAEARMRGVEALTRHGRIAKPRSR